MKNTRITRILAIAATFAVAGALASCSGTATSGGPNEDRPENEIHVLVLGDAAASAEQAAADRFNETSDIKVVIDSGPTAQTEYDPAIRNSIGTASAPDIFMSWSAAGIQPLIDAGAVLPLDDFIAEDPNLRDSFLPSVFEAEVVDGKAYGIPMRGIAPEFLFYNKEVLASAGLEPATTWDDLLEQVPTLIDAGVIPIGLAGADKWPQGIWFQFLYAREVGNDKVAAALAGDDDMWDSPESLAALEDIRTIVDSGAFGQNYDSVSYGSDGSAALLREGKSAYELMGTWHYATVGAEDVLGWTAFPSLDGGEGQPGEIAGNLSNFYNVAADTRYPDTVREFLASLYSDDFLNDQIALGNLPPTTNAAELVDAAEGLSETNKEYLSFVVQLVADAPTFQLSWDQVVPAESKTPLQNAHADFFNGTIDAATFIQAMKDLTP
jgi:xylobiose transport system substrate-binding protein